MTDHDFRRALLGTASVQIMADQARRSADVLRRAIFTWQCQKCGWGNDNNNGPCRKCGDDSEGRARQ